MSILRTLAIALFGLMLVGGVAIADDKKDEKMTKGTIKKVDAEKDTITVTVDGKDTDYTTKDAKVMAGKKELKLADLKEGQEIMFKSKDGKAIEAIMVAGKKKDKN